MIDLLPIIREFIISDIDLTANLSSYKNSKSVFTRRPIPEDIEYPIILINPPVTQSETDFLNIFRREVVYDIIVYGKNDTSENYRKVEETAFLLANKFARLNKNSFNMPSGSMLVQAIGIGPLIAPTDDENMTARAVSVTFTIIME